MAFLLQEWWLTEYAVDIHNHMRSKETSRKSYRARSPQLSARRHLVERLSRTAEKHGLCVLVKHLAVLYLDLFMDSHNINFDQLHLVSLACLLVAAKSEEKDSLIPKASELNKSADDYYELKDFVRMEKILLEFFHWDLVISTAAHFFEYYSCYMVIEEDLKPDHAKFKTFTDVQLYSKKYSEYFLEASINDTIFLRFPASLVAAACIATTRICLLLSPCWPNRLSEVTNYPGETLSTCVELLIRYLENDEEEFNACN